MLNTVSMATHGLQ